MIVNETWPIQSCNLKCFVYCRILVKLCTISHYYVQLCKNSLFSQHNIAAALTFILLPVKDVLVYLDIRTRYQY